MAHTLSSTTVSTPKSVSELDRSLSPLAYGLSSLLAVVALAASAAGFFITDLFQRDNTALAGCARGTALVILAVAVPILVISMILSARGSLRARLVWLGMLVYLFYNGVYFTFGATFNRFFLAFLAMLGLAGWSLLVLLIQWKPQEIKEGFAPKTRARLASIYMLFPVLIFLATDLKESIAATVTNSLPPSIIDTQLTASPFVIINLPFLVPLFLIAAAWLWQRRAWGYTLAGMMITYFTIELVGIGSDQWFGGQADPQSPLASASAMPAFLIMSLVSLVVLVMFLRGLHGKNK